MRSFEYTSSKLYRWHTTLDMLSSKLLSELFVNVALTVTSKTNAISLGSFHSSFVLNEANPRTFMDGRPNQDQLAGCLYRIALFTWLSRDIVGV